MSQYPPEEAPRWPQGPIPPPAGPPAVTPPAAYPGHPPAGPGGAGDHDPYQGPVGLPPGARCHLHRDRVASAACRSCGQPICTECMVGAPVGWLCQRCAHRAAPSGGRRTSQGGLFGLRYAPVTAAIAIVCVLVFLVSQNSPSVVYDAVEWGAQVSNGQWYRLFTAIFIHYNVLHIGMDMFALVLIGRAVEPAIGRWRYLALFLLAGVAGNVACYLLTAPDVASAGSSGAVFGIFSAYFVLARRASVNTSSIVGVIVLNLVIDFGVPGISWEAHVGGLVAGLVVMLGFVWARHQRRPVVADVAVVLASSVVLGLLMLLPVGAANLG